MSRIYIVTASDGSFERYVRANTLNGAIRAVAHDMFGAKPATTEQMYHAFKGGFEVLDTVEPEQLDLGGGNE